ncbi:MAG TPA: ABC transporter permease, partial [Terriglobales bacterium]
MALIPKRKRSPGTDDFHREIAFHLDALVAENIARGMSPEEARRQASIAFGGREQITQELREVHATQWLEMLHLNARAALRFARRYPSFSLAVVLTIALAVGANTAVFSAIDAVLLRPLPFPHSDQLVLLEQHNRNKDSQTSVAATRLEDWNRLNSTFAAISGYYFANDSETSGELPERLAHAMVAPRFLQVFGVAPALGRDFTPQEEHWGGPSAVIISDRLWHRRFNASPDVLGKQLHFGTWANTIVGVMPPSFQFPAADVDIWSPSAPDAPFAQDRNSTWFTVIGRVKDGVSLERAFVDLSAVQSQLAAQYPKTDAPLTISSQRLKNTVLGNVGRSLWLLYAAVSVLLLLACVNLAALLLARTSEREHEISVRFSLGASRFVIVAQLLSEIFFLALIGSLLGLAIAAGSTHALQGYAKQLPRAQEISLHPNILWYTLGCSLLVTFACGLVPALRGTRRELARSLAGGSRTQSTSHHRLQRTLLSTQIALAVALLLCAGLLLRSFSSLIRSNPGFNPEHVLSFSISGSWAETADQKKLSQRIERTLETLRALPGVEAAATASFLPGTPGVWQTEIGVSGLDSGAARNTVASTRPVSEGYFDVVKIPTLQGTTCAADAPVQQAVVNRSFAQSYAGSNLIGRHLKSGTGANALDMTVVGVVADAREAGLAATSSPTVYACIDAPGPSPNYLVRTRTEPMSMAQAIRRVIHDIEPSR